MASGVLRSSDKRVLDRLRHRIGRRRVLAAQRAVPAVERRLGLQQALVREVERLAVVRREQQQADRLARDTDPAARAR